MKRYQQQHEQENVWRQGLTIHQFFFIKHLFVYIQIKNIHSWIKIRWESLLKGSQTQNTTWLPFLMHQSIPSTNIHPPPPPQLTPREFFKVVKFPAPGQKMFPKLWPGAKKDKNPAPGGNFVDLQDNFAMIVKPFAFFWYSSLAWLSSSFFKDYEACEYKISQW